MLELQLLTVLCSLAATAFAAAVPASAGQRLVMAGIFAATVAVLGPGRLIAPSAAAGLTAAAATLVLLRPHLGSRAAGVLVGASAGLAATGFAVQGLPLPVGVALAAVAPAVTVWLCARNGRFVTLIMREEALLIVAGLGILLAVGPDIAAGWQSAVALRAQPLESPAFETNGWAFIAVGACLSLGCLWAYLRRGR